MDDLKIGDKASGPFQFGDNGDDQFITVTITEMDDEIIYGYDEEGESFSLLRSMCVPAS